MIDDRLILSKKYRPQKFSDVIGQESVIRGLCSSIKLGTLGHSLIFTGTRGSGKTTTARLIAKFSNCKVAFPGEARFGIDTPLVEEPCGECQACLMVEQGVHPAVLEIDAASNNSVDNIRELIDRIRYNVLGHRVICLDEVHMLSKGAFNSLLKTLEEPPPGVTFILITTEPHKLIPTIKSRCQMYEFQSVPVEVLVEQYTRIAKLEGIDINESTLKDVALRADGSVRDGLTLLQKFLSGTEEEDQSDKYFQLAGAIYAQDTVTALSLVSDLRKHAEDRTIIQMLEKWFYWCSLECFGQKTPIRRFFDSGSVKFDLTHLQALFDTCLDVERHFIATPNAKAVLDMGIIKLTLYNNR